MASKLFVQHLPKVELSLAMVLLLAGATWVAGFYTPVLAPYVYSTRWLMAIGWGLLSLLIISTQKTRSLEYASKWLVILLATMLVSTIYSYSPNYSLLRAGGACALLLATYFLVVTTTKSKANFFQLFYVILFLYAGLTATILAGVLDPTYGSDSSRLQVNEYLKATGAGNTALSAILLFVWLLRYSTSFYRVAVTVLIGLLILILFYTRSRTAIAGAAILIPFAIAVFHGGKLKLAISLLGLTSIIVGSVLYLSPQTATFLRIDDRQFSRRGLDFTSGRADRWEYLYEHGLKNPFLATDLAHPDMHGTGQNAEI